MSVLALGLFMAALVLGDLADASDEDIAAAVDEAMAVAAGFSGEDEDDESNDDELIP